MLTPHDVHFGLAEQRRAERAGILATAYSADPERFPAGPPVPAPLPAQVWINSRHTEKRSYVKRAFVPPMLPSLDDSLILSAPGLGPNATTLA
jgi:hypothetical protein